MNRFVNSPRLCRGFLNAQKLNGRNILQIPGGAGGYRSGTRISIALRPAERACYNFAEVFPWQQ
jgi:hypothetical protein